MCMIGSSSDYVIVYSPKFLDTPLFTGFSPSFSNLRPITVHIKHLTAIYYAHSELARSEHALKDTKYAFILEKFSFQIKQKKNS
jgi:hypothetical protein